jgi:hypothetical protein
MPSAHPLRYDAVVFDLLTALIDSWTLWNDVAGSPEAGLAWRKKYLDITYGCGAYRPYETLVREAAQAAGLPAAFGARLEDRWNELAPWPEAPEPPPVAGPLGAGISSLFEPPPVAGPFGAGISSLFSSGRAVCR